MKRILTTLKAKWPEYLLEIFVITIGILGAFTLNNWNESRKDNQREKSYLEGLLSDFQNDSLDLVRFIRITDYKVRDGAKLQSYIAGTDTIDDARIIGYIFFNGRFLDFRPSIPSYDELISTGQQNLIQNKKITGRISNYLSSAAFDDGFYRKEFQARITDYNRHIFNYFNSELMQVIWNAPLDAERTEKKLTMDLFEGYRVDLEGFRKDPESLYFVEISTGLNAELSRSYTNYLKRTSEIINLIKEELSIDD